MPTQQLREPSPRRTKRPRLGELRIGTSGWIYPHWRGLFYAPDLPVRCWFAVYAEHFDTVEINNTFYRLPAVKVFEEWRKQAPPGFLYAVKASRFLTHMKKLKDPEAPLENVLGRARHLRPHLGPVLFQLPPRWHCNLERLRQFVAALPRGGRFVFEFRDPSWYRDEIRELLTEAGMSFCIHDFKGQPCPNWVTGPLVYLRFHGSVTLGSGSYDRPFLRRWAGQVDAFRQCGTDVFVYFNNDLGGHALTNARALKELLGQK